MNELVNILEDINKKIDISGIEKANYKTMSSKKLEHDDMVAIAEKFGFQAPFTQLSDEILETYDEKHSDYVYLKFVEGHVYLYAYQRQLR